MSSNTNFDLDLSATTDEQVVIGKVKLSDDPERIVDIYSPDTKYYARLLKFQRKARKLVPIFMKQEKGELDITDVPEEDIEAAFAIGDDIMSLVRPLMPDVKEDEEVDITPQRAGELLHWVLEKAAALEPAKLQDQKAKEPDAEKKTTALTSPTA